MIAWTIAGSDSGGGAGIQADLKTFHSLGAHGCSALVALTAQNTQGVQRVEAVSPAMIAAQMASLATDLPPAAVKTGMLGTRDVIAQVADQLQKLDTLVVVDPVMVATSGDLLLEADAKQALIERILPLADVLTPNRPEAQALVGGTIQHDADVIKAADTILSMGAKSVLIKGGHDDLTAFCQDYWTDGQNGFWLTSPKYETPHTHGSGCTLSAALAALLALGYPLREALVIAKAFITAGIRTAQPLGSGFGPVRQTGWPRSAQDMPWLTRTGVAGRQRPQFPDCGSERLGFYPIIDRSDWLERLLPCGVRTVQLRVKDLKGDALRAEIAHAIDLCERHDARLFVNDYWQLAIELGAYGVHLGQEDLHDADAAAIAAAGLRLGISTHSYEELARALAYQPSYVALGPIFETTSKVMRFGPQGLDRLGLWRQLVDCPLVAIGGIDLERAPAVLAKAPDSIAVISAITQAPDPEATTRQWLKLLTQLERNHHG